jgi:2-desacetyl-2-hydroxyethyl bacteriochlorophyllide A dehydrogenase
MGRSTQLNDTYNIDSLKAAVLEEPKKIVIKEIAKPQPKVGELLVRLLQVGICGSDIHFFKGDRPIAEERVIGHEGIGIIEKIGAGISDRQIGERVAIEPNMPCNHCKQCKKGKGNSCGNKRVIGLTEHGCFAEYICIPSEFAHTIPPTMQMQDAVCIEPMAVAYHALKSAAAKPGDSILVIGLGSIGMLLTHLAIQLKYQVYTMELNTVLSKKATSMGAIEILTGSIQILNEQLEALEIQTIFECAGAASTAELACNIAARGTEIILLGLSEKPSSFQPLKIARENISIRGSIIYDHPTDFQEVMTLIENGTLKPSMIISEHYPIDQLQIALEKAAAGHAGKIIIDIASTHE